MSKVLFILMPEFKDTEFATPYKILTEHVVDIAGLESGPISGADGMTFTPNLEFRNVDESSLLSYDALVIPGGPGSKTFLWDNKELQKAIKLFHENKKLIAAICYAVIAVVKTGILLGKHATVYPTDEAKDIFEEYGIKFSKDGVVKLSPEKIITAQGPQQAHDFGSAINSFLKHNNSSGKEKE